MSNCYVKTGIFGENMAYGHPRFLNKIILGPPATSFTIITFIIIGDNVFLYSSTGLNHRFMEAELTGASIFKLSVKWMQ